MEAQELLANITARMNSYDVPTQCLWLLRLSHELTMLIRNAYSLEPVAAKHAMTNINEWQHKVLAVALQRLTRESSYPNEVLAEILIELASNAGMLPQLSFAVEHANRRCDAKVSNQEIG